MLSESVFVFVFVVVAIVTFRVLVVYLYCVFERLLLKFVTSSTVGGWSVSVVVVVVVAVAVLVNVSVVVVLAVDVSTPSVSGFSVALAVVGFALEADFSTRELTSSERTGSSFDSCSIFGGRVVIVGTESLRSISFDVVDDVVVAAEAFVVEMVGLDVDVAAVVTMGVISGLVFLMVMGRGGESFAVMTVVVIGKIGSGVSLLNVFSNKLYLVGVSWVVGGVSVVVVVVRRPILA